MPDQQSPEASPPDPPAPDDPSAGQRYLVTARKYRPARFSELVAQEHVAETLKNAIRQDRLAHAYLFSGPRGVGKTTAARILAKAINCETPLDERPDGAEPCRECDSCEAFEAGRSLNVFELDAASNNKVDDIRELRETVRIPPQGSKKKVYILDEVHMLSNQAFNALLKTLEEPPAHALFIFATTEPHKVLATILSRCQRFDFSRIPVPDIVERLRSICEAEGITADEESLMLLARKGDGALRDALSAFDQAVSLCGTDLEYGDLAQAMGVVDRDLFFDLTDHVAERNSAGVLQLVEHVVRTGYDMQEFLSGLAEHVRNLLVATSMGDASLVEAAESTRQRYLEASEPFTEADLLRLLAIVGEAEEDVKNSSQPRLKLEMALLKMATVQRAGDLDRALRKIDRLEQMVEDGTLPERLDDAGAAPASGTDAADGAAEHSTRRADTASSEAASPDASSTAAEPSSTYAATGDPETATEKAPADTPVQTESTPQGADEGEDEPEAEGETSGAETSSAERSKAASPDAGASDAASSEAEGDESAPVPSFVDAATDEEDTEDEPAPASTSHASASQEPGDEGASPSRSDQAADDEAEDEPKDEPAPNAPADDEGDAPAPPDPQKGYRDLFGQPALQRDDDPDEGREGGGAGGSDPSAGSGQSSPSDASAAGSAPSGDGSPGDAPQNAYSMPGEDAGGGTAVAEPDVAVSSRVEAIRDIWATFAADVKSDRIQVGTFLQQAEPAGYHDGTLEVTVPKDLHRRMLRDHADRLIDRLSDRVDLAIDRLQFIVEAGDEAAGGETTEETDPYKQMEKLRDQHPTIDAIFDEFGGELAW